MSYEFGCFVSFVPAISSLGLTLALRRSWATFAVTALSLLLLSSVLAMATPSVIVRDDGAAGKLGYGTWAVVASVATAAGVLGIWRLLSMPRVVATVIAAMASFMALYMGAWIS
ncbi:hypothetical protein V1318_16280 [Lysobacter sp. CCNWLW3]|uniref:hypothetical protein n=1 Tax=unclassified Lysobacter TaxID=2635362 RepID=UPI002FD1311E